MRSFFQKIKQKLKAQEFFLKLKKKLKVQVPDKLKNHFLWLHRKELFLYICILITVFGTVKAATVLINSGTSSQIAANVWTPNCYRIYINGADIGLVETREDGEAAIKQAISNLIIELGYDPDVKPEIRYYEEYNEDSELGSILLKIPTMQEAIKDGIDVIKVKAYAMKIGEDFVVALHSEDDVEKVLENAQKLYVSDDTQFDVMLSKSEYNSLVEVPEIVLVQEALDNDRSFTTTANEAADSSETYNEAKAKSDSISNSRIVSAEFTEDIMVVETFVDEATILTVDKATELITKENEEPKTYVVKAGDCPSIIADSNNMSLDTLYKLNPSLENGEFVQIGDEVTVMVPEAEISVTTTEEVNYTQPVERGISYIENPDVYVGTNKVISEGSDGEKLVTALVTRINGDETGRRVKNEQILTEPENKVIEKGVKALPPKGATGQYIMPVANYILSSGYGYRWGEFHAGIDLAAPTGTTIMATDGGVVTYAGWYYGYGYLVTIDHGNGVTTRYGHCSSISVSVGQQVSQYQEIAKVGSTGNSTGPHCHFEIRFDGTPANPLNYVN